MSVDGVWRLEMLSPYGWEQVATAFLRKGRYHSASADHYTIGKYKEDGKDFKLKARSIQHGVIRTVFGSKEEKMDIRLEGKIKRADKIVGHAWPVDGSDFDLTLRLIRIGDLD